MEMMRGGGRSLNGAVGVQNISANNLLQGFIITSNQFCYKESENGETEEAKKREEEEEEEDEIELTLGLSLNGQFGTDPRSRKRKNFELGRSSSIPEGFIFDEHRYGRDGRDLQLDRTRSLPVETELEMEAKRKRSEEPRAFLEFNVPERKENSRIRNGEDGQRDGFVREPVNGKGRTVNTMKKNLEVSGMEKARNILEEMPCVSTRDVGADGKRVEGFLYWYGGNKEEVKIVCVCHGSFLSPAEFVRHGGGGGGAGGDDIATNPLRHIVVKLPNSSL